MVSRRGLLDVQVNRGKEKISDGQIGGEDVELRGMRERLLFDLFDDALFFAEQAEAVGRGRFHECARNARVSILSSITALECAANSALERIRHGQRFRDDVDKLPFLSKFELFRKGVTAAGVGLLEVALSREGAKGCSPVLCSSPVALEPPYERLATALLAKVRTLAPPAPVESLFDRRVPERTITEKEIIGLIITQGIDELAGKITELRFVAFTDDDLGLDEAGWTELEALTHLAHRHLPNSHVVSERFVKDTLIAWLRHRGDQAATETFPTYLLRHVEQAVVTRTILIPIANLYIDADFLFGPVQLRVITPALIHSWYEAYRAACPPEKLAALDALFDRFRKELQGLTAVSLTIEADEPFAVERCLELAEQAVALLRVLDPANTSPHATLYVRPLGSENIESFKAFRYQGTTFRGRQEGARPPYPTPFEITADRQREMAPQLATLADLLATPDRTAFTRTLFDALLIYSRNNIAKEVYDKLVFCMIAVEAMLLRDQQEPIQTHISERMAYLLGRTVEERLAIETLVKRCYDIRSRFVHGHQQPADLLTVAEFMHNTWALFLHLVNCSAEFPTKDALIDRLRQRKYR